MTNHLIPGARPALPRWAAIVAGIGLALPSAQAGLEAFMRLGILGNGKEPIGSDIPDASVPTHDGWFPIRFVGQSMEAATSYLAGGGVSVGKPVFGNITVEKNVDFASPSLFAAIASGTTIDQAEIVFREAGTIHGPFYTVTLKSPLITRVAHRVAGDGPERAVEGISMAFKALQWAYQRVDTEGRIVFESTVGWDQAAQKLIEGTLPGIRTTAPSIRADGFLRVLASGVHIPIVALLANDSPDAAFDQLGPSTTAVGGTVVVSGDQIIYTPPSPDPGGDDGFSYGIRNKAGGINQTTVILGVKIPGPTPNFSVTVSDHKVGLNLSASPGLRIQLQWADQIGGPWTDLGAPITADAAGHLAWADALLDGTRYYRAVIAP